MVGAPSRSKACNTCRERRIACSLERPHCAQCLKSNLDCGGYHREHRFILSHSHVATGETITGSPNISFARNRNSERRLPARKRGRPPADAFSLSPVSPQHMYRQQLLSAYVDGFLATSHFESSGRRSWLSFLSQMSNLTRALELALLAVATAATGRMNHDPALVRESRRFYIVGLNELQKALWNPSLMYRDETLAACLNLSMYELFECPTGTVRGYLVHQEGCAKMVQLRGPRAHTKGLGHSLFRVIQFLEIQRAIADGRPTFLSDPIWRKVPYEEHQQRDFDCFLDVLSLAPDILRHGPRLKDLRDRDLYVAALPIIDQTYVLVAKLRAFYKDFEATNPGPLYWPVLSTTEHPTDDPERGKLFPIAFRFSNLNVARTVVIYWTTMAMLCSQLCRLCKRLQSISALEEIERESSPSTQFEWSLKDSLGGSSSDEEGKIDLGQFLTLDHGADVLHLVRNVCQSVDYYMQEDLLAIGPALAIFPLVCMFGILGTFPNSDRELLWVKGALCHLHDRGVRFLAPFVPDLRTAGG